MADILPPLNPIPIKERLVAHHLQDRLECLPWRQLTDLIHLMLELASQHERDTHLFISQPQEFFTDVVQGDPEVCPHGILVARYLSTFVSLCLSSIENHDLG